MLSLASSEKFSFKDHLNTIFLKDVRINVAVEITRNHF